MTNQPLTAEEKQRLARIWDMSDASMSQLNAEDDVAFLLCLVRKMEIAAQHNAELVAKLAKLKELNSDLNKDYNKLLAENDRLKQQLAWQPIETAPKDGTEFDIWSNPLGFRLGGVSWRTPTDDENPWKDAREAVFRDRDGYKVSFNFWRLEPQPPKEAT